MKDMNKNILLVNPPYYRLYKDNYSLARFPLALGYLSGAILKSTSWNVMAYNADFHPKAVSCSNAYLTGKGFEHYLHNLGNLKCGVWENVRETILNFKPSVIGITSMTQNFKSACNIAKIAKEIDKDIIVVTGGSHVTLLRAEVMENPLIDICVIAEGEETIVELLNSISNKDDLSKVTGIIHRHGEHIIENPERKLIGSIDSLPFPHKSAAIALKDFDKYPLHAFQHIFSIRGCPYNCFFCGSRNIWGRRPRFRSTDNVIEEIVSLKAMGLNSVIFEDDTFGVKDSYILELCDKIKKYVPGIEWSCEMHVKGVTDKIISAMKSSGCRSIIIGIESGNNEILKKIRKNNTIEDCYKAARIIKQHKILLSGFFMVGFPWETEESLNDTAEAIKKINCDSTGYSIFTPYKGTEAFEICKEMGLIDKDYDINLYHHQSPHNCFCRIPKDRFRAICYRIEKMIDRLNRYNRIKGLISFDTVGKIKRSGLRNSIKKAVDILGIH
jgi:tRNA A37 methylthiotransferase MiaB